MGSMWVAWLQVEAFLASQAPPDADEEEEQEVADSEEQEEEEDNRCRRQTRPTTILRHNATAQLPSLGSEQSRANAVHSSADAGRSLGAACMQGQGST
jgi:hypothetical protein